MDGVYVSDYIYHKASMSMWHKYILVVFEFDDLKARDLKKNSKHILIDITLLQFTRWFEFWKFLHKQKRL